jgi:ornithine cyclodeaminase/alanine dehydrogenase-like protein (mu-crystallin family)
VEAAFRKLSLDEAENIPRRRCRTNHVMLHVLPAAIKTLNAIGSKAYTSGRFPARFHVYLFDPRAGGLTAILEAEYLGQVRTGAASGAATKVLARPDATTVGVYGSGRQARTQLEAVCKVRKVTRATVYSRDEGRRKAFAEEMTAACRIDVVPTGKPEEAASGIDVVITATSSREPVLSGAWVSEGAHLNLIGSNFLAKAEADVDVFRKAALITADSKEQAKLEAGDFVAPIRDGVFGWGDVYEFAHVLTGRYPGRQSPQDVTIFKSLGLGVEDVAVAAKVIEKARAAGVGKEIM